MDTSGTRIERIDIYGYDLTYVHGEYVMSGGRVINRLPSTVVRVTTGDGVKGYGEACPLGSTYLPAFGGGARAALAELAPAMLGVDAANLAQVNTTMDRTLRGHGYAKSALDIACWDILGKVTGMSVANLLGGAAPDRPASLRGCPSRPSGRDGRVRRGATGTGASPLPAQGR